jgi:hypothetical protein
MTSPLNPPTVGDQQAAFRSRLVAATRYRESVEAIPDELAEQIAVWLRDGGPVPPWEQEVRTGGQAYPPREPERGPRA